MKRHTIKILLLTACISSTTVVTANQNGTGNAAGCPGGGFPEGDWSQYCGNAYCSPDTEVQGDTDFNAQCPYPNPVSGGYVNVSACGTYSVSCDMSSGACVLMCTVEP